MHTPLRWGILGTGNIANQFVADLTHAVGVRGVAVGSRTQNAADLFADRYELPTAHPSYDALLADPDVDAVYLSLPNALHREWTLKALAAGKHVLCEKPMAANTAEAQEMFDAADKAGRVLMEAFMYRCHPLTTAWMADIAAGDIGPVQHIRTSFCYRAKKTDDNVRFSPQLAGGALMDIGCYCLNLARAVAGCEPTDIQVTGRLHPSGVDVAAAGLLSFPGGMTASFTCAMDTQANNAAHLCGRDGWIEVPVPWKPAPGTARYFLDTQTPPKSEGGGHTPTRIERLVDADLPIFGIEAETFAAVVRSGAAPPVTRDDTLGNMRLLDTLRQALGVKTETPP